MLAGSANLFAWGSGYNDLAKLVFERLSAPIRETGAFTTAKGKQKNSRLSATFLPVVQKRP
jgi:hypothetical protein